MILPELGGRVQMAYDKIKNRHFIYYNPCYQTRFGRTDRTVDLRRYRVQLAATPPSEHVSSSGLLDREKCRTVVWLFGLTKGNVCSTRKGWPGSHYIRAGLFWKYREKYIIQPLFADVPLVGESGGCRERAIPVGLPR